MNNVCSYGVSKKGPGHVRLNLPNQDAFLVKDFGICSLVVVSDGLGSKKYSHIGSQAVCNAVLKSVRQYVYSKKKHHSKNRSLPALIKKNWLQLIGDYDENDCSATCLFVLKYGKKIFAAALGDGMIFLNGKKTEDSVLIIDEKDDDFSNSTSSMTSSDYNSKWRFESSNTGLINSVLVTTDGISSDLETGKECDFATDLLGELRKEKTVLKKTAYLENMINNWPVPMHSDDQTAAVMEF